ncbi:hypothetical protein MTO96_020599 [Rhipicephalus appendiculatus]
MRHALEETLRGVRRHRRRGRSSSATSSGSPLLSHGAPLSPTPEAPRRRARRPSDVLQMFARALRYKYETAFGEPPADP